MDLKVVHDIIRFYLRKSQSSYFTPEEIDSAFNRAQTDFFEQIKPAFAANQQVSDALKPFRKKYSFTTSDNPDGLLTLPEDYVHLLVLSVVIIDAENRTRRIAVEFVNDDELDGRRDSELIPVTTYNPIAVYDEDGTIQIYPDEPFTGVVRYLRKPADVQFVYTQVGRTITYVQGSSSQPEWNDPSTNKIILKTLEILGLNTQDINILQFAQAKEQG